MQPKIYLSHSQGERYCVTALFYIEAHKDIYGWHLMARSEHLSTAFFMIENFYASQPAALYRSIEDDVYEPWAIDYPPTRGKIRCPVPESASHELERMQSIFVQEWLFFPTDPDIAAEAAAYHAHGLPVRIANIKFRRLHRFERENERWVHATPGTDDNLVRFLDKHWRFGERERRFEPRPDPLRGAGSYSQKL